jgi:hypothetical protein
VLAHGEFAQQLLQGLFALDFAGVDVADQQSPQARLGRRLALGDPDTEQRPPFVALADDLDCQPIAMRQRDQLVDEALHVGESGRFRVVGGLGARLRQLLPLARESRNTSEGQSEEAQHGR